MTSDNQMIARTQKQISNTIIENAGKEELKKGRLDKALYKAHLKCNSFNVTPWLACYSRCIMMLWDFIPPPPKKGGGRKITPLLSAGARYYIVKEQIHFVLI